jgi:hypothetical protein
VSLAGALQEYLDDPNFEQNRIEYKTNKESLERVAKLPESSTMAKESDKSVFHLSMTTRLLMVII